MKHSNIHQFDMKKGIKLTLIKIIRLIVSPNLWIWLAPLIYLVPNIILTFTETYSVLSKITNLALPLGLYLFLFSLSRKIGRTLLLFIPLIVFFIFQLVLLGLYGESIIAIDMYGNLVTTNAGEANELMSNLTKPVVLSVLLYIPSIIVGIIITIKRFYASPRLLRIEKFTSFCFIVIGLSSMFLAIAFAPRYHARREIFPYNVLENLVTAFKRAHTSSEYITASADCDYEAVTLNDSVEPKVIILVIGESTRAGSWQMLGYERETNPRLSRRGDLVNFSKVLTESNTTHKAVPLLLSDLTPLTYGDSLNHKKSIFSMFNELGYQTSFLSAQQPNHSYIDWFGAQANDFRFVGADNDNFDTRLISPLQEILSDTCHQQKFIALHTYGSHFSYKERYPEDEAFFLPDAESRARRENRTQLVNAYDNAVRRVDMLLDTIISALESSETPSVLLYVSDHAEDIFDDSRGRLLHSSPTPTYYQLHIPMVVWMSKSYINKYPEKYGAVLKNKDSDVASTTSVFHTLVDVANATYPGFKPNLSVANDLYKPTPRFYLNDYNEGVPLKHSGLRQKDFDVLKNKNIAY